MSTNFTRDHLKITVAKILQTIGWHSINTTPLEILTDILQNYLFQVSKVTNEYANEFGLTEPNLDHLGLTFRDMGISLPELEEYVKYVNFGAAPAQVCKYPVPKENQLNFLKPGSKEVVTRPVHIHEHLPPMHSILEGAIAEKDPALTDAKKPDEIIPDDQQVFKKPTDLPSGDFKKIKRDEEGSRPTREISSVMMTTSGFLSPAREGKLPEAKTPLPPPSELPPPPSAPPVVNNTNLEKPQEIIPARKPPKPIKRVEKKKDRIGKELFKGSLEDKVKKTHSKDHAKLKQLKALANASALLSHLPQGLDIMKLPPIPKNHKVNPVKFNNKALQAARMKTEKLNTTITPLPMKTTPVSVFPSSSSAQGSHVDKLLTVPDKKKVNILKKISNVKDKIEEKVLFKKEDLKEDPGSPPNLIIDEPEDMIPKLAQLHSDITIEPINPPIFDEDTIKMEPMYLDDSPPGTPSTPKTPEMMPTPVIVKEKKKRKYKVRKTSKPEVQPVPYGSFSESETVSDRPRTPKAEVDIPTPPQSQELPPPQTPEFPFGNINPYHLAAGRSNLHFLANFGGPGLIPPPLGNPLNPLSNPLFPNNFPLLNLPDFGQNPYLPPNLPPLPNPLANLLPKVEDEMPSTSTSASETTSLPPPRTPEAVSTTPVKPEKAEKKSKEHKKEKKDKLKKKAKKEKLRAKAEKKEEKKKIKKKEKREKRKEKESKATEEAAGGVPKLTLKLKSPSPRPITPDTPKKLLNIKPVMKKEPEVFEEPESETSSLAKISALVTGPPKQKNTVPATSSTEDSNKREENPETTVKPLAGPGRPRIHPVKAKPIRPKKKQSPIKKDAEGNEVWICPGCRRQDDGSPMIGCDGCDAWYHWVCVGIQVPPDQNEDWYCRHCLLKKDEDLQTDKKKKRKRKEKKEHV